MAIMSSTKDKTYIPQPLLVEEYTEFSPSLPPTISTRQNAVSSHESSATGERVSRGGGTSSSSALHMLDNERREFELNLGKAVDTLRKDYPDMLVANPDFEIYHSNIEVIDPSGVKLHGLGNYERSFSFIHAVINFFYCKEQSGLTFRLHYDAERRNIRVSWNAFLLPRALYGGIKNTLHVDGISVYELNKEGIITRHRLERLLINNAPVKEPKGVFVALGELIEPDGVPVLGMEGHGFPFQLEFRGKDALSELFDLSNSNGKTSLFASSSDGQALPENFDEDKFEAKNASRKRFGLGPITPEEFMKIEAQVRDLDNKMKEKAAALSASAAEISEREEKRAGNIFSKMLGSVFDDTCNSNWDCERPKVCCDLVVKRVCCSSGMGIIDGVPAERYKQRQMKRLTIPNGNGGDYY